MPIAVACIALLIAVVIGAAALTYTAICIIAGASFGYIINEYLSRKEQERRRQEDHERFLALIGAARMIDMRRIEARPVDSSKQLIEQIRRG